MNEFKFLHRVTFPKVLKFPEKLSWLSENPIMPGIGVINQFFQIEFRFGYPE